MIFAACFLPSWSTTSISPFAGGLRDDVVVGDDVALPSSTKPEPVAPPSVLRRRRPWRGSARCSAAAAAATAEMLPLSASSGRPPRCRCRYRDVRTGIVDIDDDTATRAEVPPSRPTTSATTATTGQIQPGTDEPLPGRAVVGRTRVCCGGGYGSAVRRRLGGVGRRGARGVAGPRTAGRRDPGASLPGLRRRRCRGRRRGRVRPARSTGWVSPRAGGTRRPFRRGRPRPRTCRRAWAPARDVRDRRTGSHHPFSPTVPTPLAAGTVPGESARVADRHARGAIPVAAARGSSRAAGRARMRPGATSAAVGAECAAGRRQRYAGVPVVTRADPHRGGSERTKTEHRGGHRANPHQGHAGTATEPVALLEPVRPSPRVRGVERRRVEVAAATRAAPADGSPARRPPAICASCRFTQPSRSTRLATGRAVQHVVPGPLGRLLVELTVDERTHRRARDGHPAATSSRITSPVGSGSDGGAPRSGRSSANGPAVGARWASALRSIVRPRWMRERTVPSFRSSTSAISS